MSVNMPLLVLGGLYSPCFLQMLKDLQEFLKLPQMVLTSRQIKIHKGPLSDQFKNWPGKITRRLRQQLMRVFSMQKVLAVTPPWSFDACFLQSLNQHSVDEAIPFHHFFLVI